MDEKSCPPVDESVDATIRERFLRQRATTPHSPSSGQATSGQVSAFDRLGGAPVSQEDQWAPQPEMTPRKIERGQQPNKEPEPQQAGSQKRRSQSRPQDEADPKKGRREGEGKPAKIQVGIDWYWYSETHRQNRFPPIFLQNGHIRNQPSAVPPEGVPETRIQVEWWRRDQKRHPQVTRRK